MAATTAAVKAAMRTATGLVDEKGTPTSMGINEPTI
jgi:hypothetical protein